MNFEVIIVLIFAATGMSKLAKRNEGWNIDTRIKKRSAMLSRKARIVNSDTPVTAMENQRMLQGTNQGLYNLNYGNSIPVLTANCGSNPYVINAPNLVPSAPATPSPKIHEFEDERKGIDDGIAEFPPSVQDTWEDDISKDVEILETIEPRIPLGPNSKTVIHRRTDAIITK